jgi:hypothetical protein
MNQVHHIAGRLRLKFPELKNQRELARTLEEALRELQDIRLVQINAFTGSVLIHYEVRGQQERALLHSVEKVHRRFNLPAPAIYNKERNNTACRAHASGAADDLLSTLLGRAVENCVERSVIALVCALL